VIVNFYRADDRAAKNRVGPARRARVAAQALKGHRAGPALSTINCASGRARVVLFRAVPRAVNRARPIWNTIHIVQSP
jgi:hypothetical protein